MNSFQNKSGNFINSIVDDTIVLESVTEELDSYDLDDDSVMESVIDMVMEGNPNNRIDATRAGVLTAKIDAKMGDVAGKIFSSGGNDRARYENRYETLKSRRDAIENKYSRKLADPRGGKRNYYSDSYGYQVQYGPYDGHENVRKCVKKIMDCGKNVPNRKSPYDPYKVKPKKKANEDADSYDEFDRLVDEAIEEAERYDEASEGLFTNEVIASVSKFRDCGMREEEAYKSMKELIVFAIANGIAKKNVSKNVTELRKKDLHYITGDGNFLKYFLSKWYRIADEKDTSITFSKSLRSSYRAHKAQRKEMSERNEKMLAMAYDRATKIEAARAGAARININNSSSSNNTNSNINYASIFANSSSRAGIFESVDESDVILEALFEKRTLDTVLQSYLKQLEKKLNTVEACDKFLAMIKQDQAKFNNALKVCADAKIKLDKDQIDKKQFKNLTKSATKQISGYCKTFKLKMSDFGDGGSKASQSITKEDIVNFKQYVTGLIAGVRGIKKKRQAIYKEMNRKVGQRSTLNEDIASANEASFNDIFKVNIIDE